MITHAPPYPESETSSWLGTDTLELYSGGSFNYQHPRPTDIDIYSIANSLAQTVRFAGQNDIEEWMSVAQHSMLVTEILRVEGYPLEIIQGGFLHDGQEAFIRDHPRPMKPRLGQEYRDLEMEVDSAIAAHFNINVTALHDPAVKAADRVAMLNEGHVVMRHGPPPSEVIPLPIGVHVQAGLEPVAAKQAFLTMAYELGLVQSD